MRTLNRQYLYKMMDEHPEWEFDNLRRIAEMEDNYDRIMLIAEYHWICPFCGKEMGEHPRIISANSTVPYKCDRMVVV
jgi:hypothetical protein